MKVCKRIPLECVNKCGAKDIPREEVSDITMARKYLYSPCDVNDRQLIPGKTLEAFLKYVLRKRYLENNTARVTVTIFFFLFRSAVAFDLIKHDRTLKRKNHKKKHPVSNSFGVVWAFTDRDTSCEKARAARDVHVLEIRVT